VTINNTARMHQPVRHGIGASSGSSTARFRDHP
jgi:hypothetical protein